MVELTEELAQKINRAAQILSGLCRAASKDCTWVRNCSGLHAEIVDLQNELREAAARVTGDHDMGEYFAKAQAVGIEIGELFPTKEKLERLRGL